MTTSITGTGKHDGVPICGLQADTDLSSYQFTCVKIKGTTERYITSATDVTALAFVLLNKPDAAGKAAELCGRPGDIVPIIAAGAISTGAEVMPTTGGKVTTRTGAGYGVGFCLNAPSADGDFAEVLYFPLYHAS